MTNDLREKISELIEGKAEIGVYADAPFEAIVSNSDTLADAICALLPTSPQDIATAEDAAKLIDEKIENYVKECGMYDSTTGVTEYPGTGEEWVHDMEELAEEIRLLKPTKSPPQDLSALVAEIDGLYTRASIGPWVVFGDDKMCVDAHDEIFAPKCAGATSKAKLQNNAALIVALVNRWPALKAALSASGWRPSFQKRVAEWMLQCFTPEITADKLERNDRFIEEALELVQSTGYCRERAHKLVDYVFDRPPGDPDQEVGGVMVTLAALCGPNELDVTDAAERELARILQPQIIEKIRAKQASKPTGSALPIPECDPLPPPPTQEQDDDV